MRALVLAAASAVAIGAARADEPAIKIGWIMSYSGPGAQAGAATDAAIAAFQKRYGTTAGGRKVEIIRRDTTGPAPDVVRRLTQELIVGEKVDFLAGMDYSANTLAAAPLTTSGKTPLLLVNFPVSGILPKFPYLVRFGFTTSEVAQQLAKYASRTGYKNVYTFVHELESGLDAEAMFIREFKAAGGAIAGSGRAPLKTTDYSPYIQRIKDAKPDAVFVFMAAGALPSIFLKQVKDAGLDKTTKIIGTGDITDETNLSAAGDAALGVVTAFHYTPTHDSQVNKDFVADYQGFAGPDKQPNFVAEETYDILRAIYDVVEKQQGALSPAKSIELLSHEAFEGPRGPFAINPATRDVVQTIYLRRVEKIGDRLQNVEFEQIPKVEDPGSAR